MKLIKNLGLGYPKNKSYKSKRATYGLYECPLCFNHIRVKITNVKNGYTTACSDCRFRNVRTHGKSGTVLHIKWKSMRQRCLNKSASNYNYYGGSGIKICKEWASFTVFEEWAINNGFMNGMTIERKDTKKNYTPDNCRWIPMVEQAGNKLCRNATGYIGVHLPKGEQKYVAQITVKGVKIYLGRFKKIEDAASAYDDAIDKHKIKNRRGNGSNIPKYL